MKIVGFCLLIVAVFVLGCRQSDKATSKKNKGESTSVKKINILDLGGKNDGIISNSDAIEIAINSLSLNGGGILYFPKGHYIITRPILLKDNVILEGAGESSIIENKSKDNILSTVVFAGIHHPAKNSEYQYTLGSSIKANSNKVTIPTKHDFKVGDVLLIHSELHEIGKGARGAKNATSKVNYKIPNNLIGNKITAIKGNEIVFEYAFDKDVVNPQLTKALGAKITKGYETYSCENAVLRRFTLKTTGKAFRFGWAYKCNFEDLRIEAESSIFGNAYQHCRFSDITGTFSNRFIEIKNGSHNTIIENCNVTFNRAELLKGKDKNGNVISIGEKAFGIEITNCIVDAGNYDLNRNFILLNGEDCKLEDNKFTFSGETIKTFLLMPGVHSKGNIFTKNEVNASGTFNNFVRIGTKKCAGGAKVPSDNRIFDNKFLGKPRQSAIQIDCGKEIVVQNNFFENGKVNMSKNGYLENNTIQKID